MTKESSQKQKNTKNIDLTQVTIILEHIYIYIYKHTYIYIYIYIYTYKYIYIRKLRKMLLSKPCGSQRNRKLTLSKKLSQTWKCVFKLAKKVPVILHDLKCCESQLIIQETGQFEVKISSIPNGLKNHMAFKIIRICFLLTLCNLWILA